MRPFLQLLVLAAVLCVLCNPFVNAFGREGHYIIGEAVWRLLSNESRAVIDMCSWRNGSFGDTSNWADNIKAIGKYRWSSPFHYYDVSNDPPESCGYIPTPPIAKPKINLINGIQRAGDAVKRTLEEGNCTVETQSHFYFRLLVHMLQDLHQPLHLTGKFRGGNDVSLTLNKRKMSLHHVWDSQLILWHLERIGNASIDTIQHVIDVLVENGTDTISCDNSTFLEWAAESSELNCNVVWRYSQMSERDYLDLSNATIFKQLQMAVVREACHLDSILVSRK